MVVESDQNAGNQTVVLKWMLENYGETHENYAAFSGDNRSTNHSIADNTQIGFMGCANIFVRLSMARHGSASKLVRVIMKKISCSV